MQESCCLSHLSTGDIGLVCSHHLGGSLARDEVHEARSAMFLQMPSLIRRLRQGPLDPAEKHNLQEFHSGQSRNGAPHVTDILVAVGRQELIRTSSPGRAAGQTIDRQLTGRRRAWRSRPISFDVSNSGRKSESRLPHRPKNLRGRHAFRPKSLPDENSKRAVTCIH